MTHLDGQLREAEAAYWSIRAFDYFLDLILAFLAFSIVLQLLGKSILYAIVLSMAAVAGRVIAQVLRGGRVIRRLEDKNKGLDGSLVTAYEHRSRRNPIVDDLLEKTSKKMDEIGYSTFLEDKATSTKVLAIIFLSFIFLSLIVLSFQDFIMDLGLTDGILGGVENSLLGGGEGGLLSGGGIWERNENYSNPQEEEQLGGEAGGEQEGYSEGPLPGVGGGIGEEEIYDIYGDPEAANLWGEELDLEIHPEYGGDIEVEVNPLQKKPAEFLLEEVESAEEYREYPVEQEEIVRRYFERLLEETR